MIVNESLDTPKTIFYAETFNEMQLERQSFTILISRLLSVHEDAKRSKQHNNEKRVQHYSPTISLNKQPALG